MIIPLAPGEKRGPEDHKRFERYHSNLHLDLFVNGHELIRDVSVRFIVLTSRPVAYHHETVQWLRWNRISPAHLIMRNPTELRPSVAVKRTMLGWLFDANSYAVRPKQIIDAIDDREDIIAMYREAGLPARIVNFDGTQSE
jgi:hypothetical protein